MITQSSRLRPNRNTVIPNRPAAGGRREGGSLLLVSTNFRWVLFASLHRCFVTSLLLYFALNFALHSNSSNFFSTSSNAASPLFTTFGDAP